jgi:hypothetical protein
MQRSEIAKILTTIAVVFPGFEPTEARVQVYHRLLGDLEYGVVDRAVGRILSLSRFAPSIAEIREQALAVEQPDASTAAEAWGRAWDAVRRYGNYHQVEAYMAMGIDAAYIVRLIGWEAFCMETEFGVLRGQFMNMYGQVAKREAREALLPPALRVGQIERGGDFERIGIPGPLSQGDSEWEEVTV